MKMTKYTIKTPITFIFKRDRFNSSVGIKNFKPGDAIGIKNKKIYFLPYDPRFVKSGKYTSILAAKEFFERNIINFSIRRGEYNIAGDTIVLSFIYELIDANAITEDTYEYDALQIAKKEKELSNLKAKLNMEKK